MTRDRRKGDSGVLGDGFGDAVADVQSEGEGATPICGRYCLLRFLTVAHSASIQQKTARLRFIGRRG